MTQSTAPPETAQKTFERPPVAQNRSKKLLEHTRAKVLADLDRIRAEVVAYAADRDVDYGPVGDLRQIRLELSCLHLVGTEYKRENSA